MRVLVTRPSGDAEETAAKLAALGHQAVLAPLLEIKLVSGAELALDNVQAVLVTSGNAIRALAERTRRRDVRVIAVGTQSAAVARRLGFQNVESADGDADALVAFVMATLAAKGATLLHPAGKDTRGDIASRLRAQGFQIRSEVLYEAVAATTLAPAVHEALSEHRLDAALFYSPRTATIFAELARREGHASDCARLTALCISRATAEALGPIQFGDVRVAERPNEQSLFGLL